MLAVMRPDLIPGTRPGLIGLMAAGGMSWRG